VASDRSGLDELRRLGARSIPVVSRGDKFVFAQMIGKVVEFLKLDEATGPALSPAALIDKEDMILSAAIRFIGQTPDDLLANKLPNRDRSYRVLGHHVFRIAEAFLDSMEEGRELTYEMLTTPPPEALQSFEAISAYGEEVRRRMLAWCAANRDGDWQRTVPTYYGPTPLHDVFERTVWHSGQHVRQWMMILDMAGIAPRQPLAMADFAGLPLPEQVWDG